MLQRVLEVCCCCWPTLLISHGVCVCIPRCQESRAMAEQAAQPVDDGALSLVLQVRWWRF